MVGPGILMTQRYEMILLALAFVVISNNIEIRHHLSGHMEGLSFLGLLGSGTAMGPGLAS